ncbi:hypothetical protein [Pseudomonas aeruginosa]|uniref:hypothetical protein n=1 Tax=Pseudomonas aeruginosa TaxID=287 RepID=UPI002101025A|nr:hypothetical protein [Pseudomonas aeruginosa]
MAALNVTQTGMTAGAQRFLSVVEIPAELEKISCWFGGCSQANPFDFFGKRIRVGEQVTRMHDVRVLHGRCEQRLFRRHADAADVCQRQQHARLDHQSVS